MEIITGDAPYAHPLCLMIGNFDGVHRGHQSVIAAARGLAQEEGLRVAVLSFKPHPLKVLKPEKAPQLLHTPEQKRDLLAHHGVDVYISMPFTEALYTLSPEAFVAYLCERFEFRHLLVGFNFRFGHGRQGDTSTLEALGHQHGFQTHIQQACEEGERPISSSRIRDLVGSGRMDEANALLGRPYYMEGVVIHGRKLGRNIDAPTANLYPTNEFKPRYGVYASWCMVGGTWFRAISNFGEAPTVSSSDVRLETHLFDFEEHLYERRVVVALCHFMRPEEKFESLSVLKEQIHADIERRAGMSDDQPPTFVLEPWRRYT